MALVNAIKYTFNMKLFSYPAYTKYVRRDGGRPLSKFFCTSTWEIVTVDTTRLPSASAKEFG